MSQPVDSGAAEEPIGEGGAPLFEGQIAGDHGGGALVAFGDEFVEVLILRWLQGLECEVINDEEGYPHQGLKATIVGLHGAGGLELSQESGLGGEDDVVSLTHGLVAEGLGDVALAGTAGSGDEDGDLFVDEAAGGQITDLGLVDVDVESPVEVMLSSTERRVGAAPG